MNQQYDEFEFVNQYLMGDEFILWKGKPEKGNLLSKNDVFFIPFSIFWCGFAIFWIIGAASTGTPFFWMFGIPFVFVGLYMVFGRFIHIAYTRNHTYYVITNKKIIRKIGGKIDILDGQNLPSMNVDIRNGGNGNINFGNPIVRNSRRGYNMQGSQPYYDFSLDNIKNPLKVQEIIKTMDK